MHINTNQVTVDFSEVDLNFVNFNSMIICIFIFTFFAVDINVTVVT